MTPIDRFETISAMETKLSKAVVKGTKLTLSQEEVGLCIELNIHAAISRAKDEAMQEFHKWQEANRKVSTGADRTGSTSTANATAPRVAPISIFSGTTRNADAQSALQRAHRCSRPRNWRSTPTS